MKIVVTGGAGFIASHVADGFVAAGHEVVIFDDLSSGRRENIHSAARLMVGDVQDPAAVRELFERERPEILCHHAAQMSVQRSVADPIFDARVNVIGLLNLLEQARQSGLGKVVFASTGGAIYGEQQVFPAPETHFTAPLSPYGIAKLASERYLFFYSQTYGIPYVALRYANVYGPRQSPHGEAGVVAIFCERLLRGEQPIINGEGRQTRDYVFIADVARANLAALTTEYCGAVNIGTGVETDVNTIFRELVRQGEFQAREEHGPAKPGEQLRSAIDSRLAQKVLGWKAQVSLADGLKQTLEFFRAKTQR